MDKKVIDKVKDLANELNGLPIVSLQDQQLIDKLNYWLNHYNSGNAGKKRGSVMYDKLVKESTEQITRFDNIQDVIKAREENLKRHREELKVQDEIQEEEDEKEEVLGNSEEKPKRKPRTRKKTTK